jgi:hypothetical protein
LNNLPSLDAHPWKLVRHLANLHGDHIEFEFSRYYYYPRALEDPRQLFTVSGTAMTEEWLFEQLKTLERGQELAIHSKLYLRGVVSHLRLVDFDGFSASHLTGLGRILSADEAESMHYFFSGRSFHGYSTLLLNSQSEWVQFMARLLLANAPAGVRVVDSRWIGHRLMAGYASLRWSANTARHLQYPESIELDQLRQADVLKRLRTVRNAARKRSKQMDKQEVLFGTINDR